MSEMLTSHPCCVSVDLLRGRLPVLPGLSEKKSTKKIATGLDSVADNACLSLDSRCEAETLFKILMSEESGATETCNKLGYEDEKTKLYSIGELSVKLCLCRGFLSR